MVEFGSIKAKTRLISIESQPKKVAVVVVFVVVDLLFCFCSCCCIFFVILSFVNIVSVISEI